MRVRGKFHCDQVTTHPRYRRDFVFSAIDQAEWAKWTPVGSLEITVDNDAIDWEPGKVYYVDIEPVTDG